MEYKYTYQDWVEGKLKTETLRRFLKAGKLNADNSIINSDNLFKIILDQENAYLKRLKETVEILKNYTKVLYLDHLIKDEFIAYKIDDFQDDLDRIIEENPSLHEDILHSRAGVIWGNLTRQEVELYLYSDWSDYDLVHKLVFEDCYYKHEGYTHLDYIVRATLLKWLKWVQKQEEKINDEPTIHYPSPAKTIEDRYLLNESVLKSRSYSIKAEQYKYSWANLFKNSKQADMILNIVGEHLSETGQWITEPKGRYLVALYTELQSKGYLKSSISAPKVAQAFNMQFDTDLASKNFQPNKIGDAEDKREYFKSIIPKFNSIF